MFEAASAPVSASNRSASKSRVGSCLQILITAASKRPLLSSPDAVSGCVARARKGFNLKQLVREAVEEANKQQRGAT